MPNSLFNLDLGDHFDDLGSLNVGKGDGKSTLFVPLGTEFAVVGAVVFFSVVAVVGVVAVDWVL